LSLLEDLLAKSPNERAISMKAHRPLRNVVLPPFLALVTLTAVAAASPGHGIGSHVRVGAHQAAGRSAPWIHAGPWMYSKVISDGPWMYGKVISDGPWMYAVIN
jgi:hypothetical protein